VAVARGNTILVRREVATRKGEMRRTYAEHHSFSAGHWNIEKGKRRSRRLMFVRAAPLRILTGKSRPSVKYFSVSKKKKKKKI
jgi:hypothetical protein